MFSLSSSSGAARIAPERVSSALSVSPVPKDVLLSGELVETPSNWAEQFGQRLKV